MLPNRVSARLCITASSGIAPDRMYTAGSATVCDKDKSVLRISYVAVLAYLDVCHWEGHPPSRTPKLEQRTFGEDEWKYPSQAHSHHVGQPP